MITARRIILIDCLISLALVGFTYIYSARFVDFSIPPFEDAAMLMRYADHLARGYGIVWNRGESPVDGATDFLFMVSAAALINKGLTVGRAVRGIGYASHILTVLLIYWLNRRIWGAGYLSALFSAMYLAVGTGLSYVAAYFGTPFFALMITLTWGMGLLLIKQEKNIVWLSIAFSLGGLAAGLVRPEGVILAGLMLIAVIVLRGLNRSTIPVAIFMAVFLLLGGIYFLWRWDYFGYPLPNPFYKKGGGGLNWDAFESSILNTIRLCLPLLLAYLLAVRSAITTRQVLAYLIPILGFAGIFVLISDETNYGARFQYGLVPMVLLTWYPLVRSLAPTFTAKSLAAEVGFVGARLKIVHSMAVIAIAAGLVYYSWYQNCFLTSYQLTCLSPFESDGRYDLGKMLSNYREKDYVLATSEAGLLPYYSGWKTIDTWGLNDPWITHHGEVTKEYLDSYHPNLIAFHAYFSPLVPPRLTEANLAQDWFRMTITLKEYAEEHGYLLAAVFGDSPYDTHYYYVRADFVDSDEIFKQISTMDRYYWFGTGKKSINYAGIPEP